MNKKYIPRLVLVALIALILMSVASALTATNTVPPTRLGQQISAVSADTLKPTQCAALSLTAIIVCSGGNCDGTDADELILGSLSNDDIRGGKGDDCILAGGGDDAIRGEQGTDVCIGGPHNDTFHPS